MITELQKTKSTWERFKEYAFSRGYVSYSDDNGFLNKDSDGREYYINRLEFAGLIQEFLDEQGIFLSTKPYRENLWNYYVSGYGDNSKGKRCWTESSNDYYLNEKITFVSRPQAFEAGCKKGFEILEEKL